MLLEIAHMGHPVLLRKADPVDDVHNHEVQKIIASMLETHEDVGGVGLSAPQVYIPLQIILFHIPRMIAEQRGVDEEPLTILINPELEIIDDTEVLGMEACLSVPGMTGEVPRYQAVRYRGLDPQGQKVERVVSGYTARVVQHEYDHLNGVLYPMRIRNMMRFGYLEEMLAAESQIYERK